MSISRIFCTFVETECLHDAEEADYELMETIIDNRLRRDSTNLQASFEDLAIRSIIEGFQIESEPESLELERQKQQKKDDIILNQEFQIEVETPVCTLIFRLKGPNIYFIGLIFYQCKCNIPSKK